MLIVSQDKENISENLELTILRNDENFIIKNDRCFLGKYQTEERAKEVLEEIIETYRNIKFSSKTFNQVLEKMEMPIYYMPKG